MEYATELGAETEEHPHVVEEQSPPLQQRQQRQEQPQSQPQPQQGNHNSDDQQIEQPCDGSPQGDKSTPTAKQADLARSFSAQVDKVIEHASRLLSMHSQQEWDNFVKHKQFKKLPPTGKAPMQPGVFLVIVSPLGTTHVRRSNSLTQVPLFKKYSDDIMWALKFIIDDIMRDQDKAEIGGNHSDPPPEYEMGDLKPKHKSRAKGATNQYSDLLKIAGRSLVGALRRKHENDMTREHRFCPRDARHQCIAGHEGGVCGKMRETFNWPKELPINGNITPVPCVDPGHMSHDMLHEILRYYSDEFPEIEIPTRAPRAG